jgi:hypothetical protein
MTTNQLMTTTELRLWSFKNSQSDQWWICLDSVTEEVPVTVDEIEKFFSTGEYAKVQVLHVSQAEKFNPSWIELYLPAKLTDHENINLAFDESSTASASLGTGSTLSNLVRPILVTVVTTALILLFLGSSHPWVSYLVVMLALLIILVIAASYEQSKKIASMTPEELFEYNQATIDSLQTFRLGPLNPKLVCPHCQTIGEIRTRSITQKKGVSGAKATGALLTAGFSILATGLSRKEQCTQAHCCACDSTWTF